MKPIISVIVIGYNIQEFIGKCLDSLISQSFNKYEIIFVNDGSKDSTLDIVSAYSDRVKILDKKNGGIVSARKAGLGIAEGDYITFVDGDDWVNVDFLKNLYDPVVANPDLDIVCTDYYLQDVEGSFSKAVCHDSDDYECHDYDFFNGIMLEKIDHHMFPKLYRRSFVMKAGYMDYPEVTMAEDWLTNAFFGLFKPYVFFSNTTNYFYRFNTSSVSRKGGKKLLEQIKTLNYMEDYFSKKCTFDYSDKIEFAWFAYVRTYLLYNVEASVKKEIINSYKNKKYNYKSNIHCKNSIDQLRKLARLKLKLEMNLPIFIPIIDSLYDCLKMLRKKYIEKKNSEYEKSINGLYDSYIERLKNRDTARAIFIIGTSDRSNIGDHAIAFSEINLFSKSFPNFSIFDITGDTFRKRRNQIRNIIKTQDIICITGGGFLGDLWPDEECMVNAILEDYPDNTVIVLPQTVFFYDEADSPILREKLRNYLNHKNLFLTARDRKTYDFFARYKNPDRIGLFPDMALYLNGVNNTEFSNDVMICLRKDKERVLTKREEMELVKQIRSRGMNVVYGSTLADGDHNGDIKLDERSRAINEKLTTFSKTRFIITDRLHGMILATLAGTPCIVFDNLSKKVSGVYELWLKDIGSITMQKDMRNIDKIIGDYVHKSHFTYSPDHLNKEKERFIGFIKKAIGD